MNIPNALERNVHSTVVWDPVKYRSVQVVRGVGSDLMYFIDILSSSVSYCKRGIKLPTAIVHVSVLLFLLHLFY